MDEVAEGAAYAVTMRLAQDLVAGEERSAVPLSPTPHLALPPLPARAPPTTTRVANRLATSANGAFVAIANRDADNDTVRLGAAALALAPRRGQNVVRAQVAAVDARGEKSLVGVREEERQALFAAAPGPPTTDGPGGGVIKRRPPGKLAPPLLARVEVVDIDGKRRARLRVLHSPGCRLHELHPRRGGDAAAPLYKDGVVLHLRSSSDITGQLKDKYADQCMTCVDGLVAYRARPGKMHVEYELSSAWKTPLADRPMFHNAVAVVKGFGDDAALVYAALSRATRSSVEELIEIVDAAAPAHVLVAFPEEEALDIGDDPDRLERFLAFAVATSAGQSIYIQSWWHDQNALLYYNINNVNRRGDMPRDLEAHADVLNALVAECTARGGPLPVVYLIGRTSPGDKKKKARKRADDEQRAIAAGKPPPRPERPDEDKSITLQLATLRLAVDAATRKSGLVFTVVEVVLQEDGGASHGELDDLNAVALMRQAKRGMHPTPVAVTSDASGGSVIAGTVAGLELELAATNAATNAATIAATTSTSGSAVARESNASGGSGSGSDAAAPASAILLFTRADRVTRSTSLMRQIAEVASADSDPATGERLARSYVMTFEVESTSRLLVGDSESVAERLCGGALTSIPPTLTRETRVGLELAVRRGKDKPTLLPLPGVLSVENAEAYLSKLHVDFLSTFFNFRHVSNRDVEARELFSSVGGGGRGLDADTASFIATRGAKTLTLGIGAASTTPEKKTTTGDDATPAVTFHPSEGVRRANGGFASATSRGGQCAFDSIPWESAAEARTARPWARQKCACDECRVSVTRPEVSDEQRQEVRRATGEKVYAEFAKLARRHAGGGEEDGHGGEGRDSGFGAAAYPAVPARASAPDESDLSDSQRHLLDAEAADVSMVAKDAFVNAWRNASPERRKDCALAAARTAIDAACAFAPEVTASAPVLNASAPVLNAPALEVTASAPVLNAPAPEVTASASAASVRKRPQYKGVTSFLSRGKLLWKARATRDGKQVMLLCPHTGLQIFTTELQAARVYFEQHFIKNGRKDKVREYAKRLAEDGAWKVDYAPKRGSSDFHGVSFNAKLGKWEARITIDAVDMWIGRFGTEERAALAVNGYLDGLGIDAETRPRNVVNAST